MTLEPWDTIWTGTPKGISHIHPGDLMRLEIHDKGEELRYLHEYLYHVPTDVAPTR